MNRADTVAGSTRAMTVFTASTSPETREIRSPVPASSTSDDGCARVAANTSSRRSASTFCATFARSCVLHQVSATPAAAAPSMNAVIRRSEANGLPSVTASTMSPSSAGVDRPQAVAERSTTVVSASARLRGRSSAINARTVCLVDAIGRADTTGTADASGRVSVTATLPPERRGRS